MTMCDSTKKAALPDGMVFAIKDWNHNFEVSQSKRVKNGRSLTWVAMPTKHDGKGLRRILRGCSEDARSGLGADSENTPHIAECGPALYGVWCLLVQLAAKMPTRGVFMDEDGALTAEDLADSIGIDPTYVETTISFCLGERMKWIELILLNPDCATRSTLGADSEQTRRTVDRSVPTGQDRTGQDRTSVPRARTHEGEISELVEKARRICEELDGWGLKVEGVAKVLRDVPGAHQAKAVENFLLDAANMPERPKNPISLLRSYLQNADFREGRMNGNGPTGGKPRGAGSDLPPSVSYDPESCKNDNGPALSAATLKRLAAARERDALVNGGAA